jgi:hypothetical protein
MSIPSDTAVEHSGENLLLREVVPGQIWVKPGPVHVAGVRFLTRMTILRCRDGVFLHSPIEIDDDTRSAIEQLGPVRAIIAPSTTHHLFVASAQQAFPLALTFGIAGLETKREDLHFDELLGDEPPALWAGEMDQVVIGNRVMCEVDFLHRPTRSLIATDLIENFHDETPGTNLFLRELMHLLGMWNHARPAPELRWLTFHRKRARLALETILAWDFDRVILAHGELIDTNPKLAIRDAWHWLLD